MISFLMPARVIMRGVLQVPPGPPGPNPPRPPGPPGLPGPPNPPPPAKLDRGRTAFKPPRSWSSLSERFLRVPLLEPFRECALQFGAVKVPSLSASAAVKMAGAVVRLDRVWRLVRRSVPRAASSSGAATRRRSGWQTVLAQFPAFVGVELIEPNVGQGSEFILAQFLVGVFVRLRKHLGSQGCSDAEPAAPPAPPWPKPPCVSSLGSTLGGSTSTWFCPSVCSGR